MGNDISIQFMSLWGLYWEGFNRLMGQVGLRYITRLEWKPVQWLVGENSRLACATLQLCVWLYTLEHSFGS